MWPKEVRRIFKNMVKQRPHRGIASLMEEERVGGHEFEYFKVYGFLPEYCNNYTDEEIKEYLDEYMWKRIYSPYDCTGESFTMWIDWHRNPCGRISYVHQMGIDV